MGIVKTESTYPSTSKEDINIYYTWWVDDQKKPIGVIQLTHGWGEYIDRYEDLAEYLAGHGYVVCGQDHLAHGLTAGLDYNGIYPGDANKAMIEDMHELYKIMHGKYKKLPYFLYGHSMGSMMTRAYIAKYGKDLSGAIVCGTRYMPWVASLLNLPINVIYGLFGSYKRSMKKAAKKAEKHPKSTQWGTKKKANSIDMLMNGWLSFDQQNIVNYINDPYCAAGMDISMLKMYEVTTRAGAPFWTHRVPKDLPIFIISGQQDMAGEFGIGPELTYQQLKSSGRNVTKKLYHHAKHEIHNESAIKDEVYADILNFIDQNNPKVK